MRIPRLPIIAAAVAGAYFFGKKYITQPQDKKSIGQESVDIDACQPASASPDPFTPNS
jgi:hypothetical protein